MNAGIGLERSISFRHPIHKRIPVSSALVIPRAAQRASDGIAGLARLRNSSSRGGGRHLR